ncbi:MAG: septal ring lytic transglycosylase RlpA family protein [Rhodospirillales bacterium]|nr:MAG: septal ring lytic transglycosylase RlpA family protein [Rhodospirillales bacterium]
MIGLLRMLRLTGLLLGYLAAAVLLSGCAKEEEAAAPRRGIYKVGKPYQVGGQWYYPKVDYAYHERGLASWYGPNFHGKPTANGEIFDRHEVSAAHKTLPLPSVVRVTNLENGRTLVVRINDRGPFVRGRIIDLSERAAEMLGFLNEGTALVDVRLIVEPSRQEALALGAANHPGFGPPPPRAAPSVDVTIENLDAPGEAPGGGAGQEPAATPPVRVASTESTSQEAPPPYDGVTNIGTRSVPPGAVAVEDRIPQDPGETVSKVSVGRRPPIFIQAGAFSQYDNANRLRARLGVMGYPVRVHQVYITNQPMFRVRVGPLDSVEAADQTLDRLVAAGYPDAQIVID